jgi:hypothetical protein
MVQTSAERLDRPQTLEGLALRSSRYERVCIALTSVVLLLGAITAIMLLTWMTGRIERSQPSVQVSLGGNGPRDELNAPPDKSVLDFEPPGEQELPETSPALAKPAMESIPIVVESQLVTLEGLNEVESDRRIRGKQGAGGDGPLGGGILGTNVKAKSGDRWEVRFSTSDIEEYKRQLDFFGIELGVAGGGMATVDYVKDFTSVPPTTRLAQDPKREKRIRFLYRDGPLKQADRELARAAGIEIEGRVVFQFYKNEMYQILLKLENDRMKPHYISDVVRTVFGIKKIGDRYEFYVMRQDYRHTVSPPPRTVTSSN